SKGKIEKLTYVFPVFILSQIKKQNEESDARRAFPLFFGIGEFEYLQDSTDPRVHVVTLPEMKKYAQFGLEFGRKRCQTSRYAP
ncbi:MAG: hypothetical protein JSV31_29335, partial [Desulfobacterales bacterium]